MYCKKCGVMVKDDRQYCPNCGNPVSAQAHYMNYSGNYFDQPEPAAPSAPPTAQQQGAARKRKRKKVLIFMAILVLVFIIIFASIGYYSMNRVSLQIVTVDTEGADMVLTIKNNGWGDAEGDKIQVRCNGKDKFDWPEGDIGKGQQKTAEFQVAVDGFYFIEKVEIFYDGELQDRQG